MVRPAEEQESLSASLSGPLPIACLRVLTELTAENMSKLLTDNIYLGIQTERTTVLHVTTPVGTFFVGEDGKIHVVGKEPASAAAIDKDTGDRLQTGVDEDVDAILERIESRIKSERTAMDGLLKRIAATA
jgi:hypothetical protein